MAICGVKPSFRAHPNPTASRRRLPAPSASSASASLSTPHSSSSKPRKTLTLTAASVAATAAAAAGGALILQFASPPPNFPGSGGGGSGGGGGGSGGAGSGGGSFWSRLFRSGVASAKEEERADGQDWDSHGLPANIVVPLDKLSGMKRYKISDILFFDRRRGSTTSGTEDSFFEMVSLRAGGVYTKLQLQKELESLISCGMFEKLDLEPKTKPDGSLALTVSFTESTWNAADAFRCINVGLLPQSKQVDMDADMTDREKMEYFRSQERDYKRRIERSRPCLLPIPVQREVTKMLREQGKVSARMLQRVRNRVQQWYYDEGYACAQVVNFGNLHTREVVCEVVEGDITKLDIQFQDKLGNIMEGNTDLAVVRRELPKQLRPGHVFNIEAGKQALRNLNSLALFSNIEVNPRPDEKNEGAIIVEIKLKELEQKSAEVSTEWSIVPGRQGRPTLASIQPGGSVSFEHRNIKGLNRSVLGSVTSSNLLNPQDDLAFKLEYVHPYVDGVFNPRNRTFRTSCFNSRKLSPVFTGGPGLEDVPPVWIDRVGFKANISEAFTRQSKFTYGLVCEEITTRDETTSICTHGSRPLPTGGLSIDGPPTTLGGTGIDRMAFAQANITRDNTKFVNGAVVGDRDVFQLDQGLGIGNNFPFFNRHQGKMVGIRCSSPGRRHHHRHSPGPGQCTSALVRHIRAPVDLVWSLVRSFDQPQRYKPFVSRCVVQGEMEVGSLREVNVKTGLPATTSTERLEVLDDDQHVLVFKIVGGDHRLRNYSSVLTAHPEVIDGRPGTMVIESFMVDVPEGNTKDETCYFVEALINCNLKSLADVSEGLALRDTSEPIN